MSRFSRDPRLPDMRVLSTLALIGLALFGFGGTIGAPEGGPRPEPEPPVDVRSVLR